MGFFHSSSSKTQHHRSKSRFSFRLHSHSHSSEDQDDRNRAGTGPSSHSRHGSRSSTAKTKTSLAQRSPSLHKQAPLPPTLALASTKGMNDESGASSFSTALPTADPLASTFVSSVSTSSDSWSASSPSILKCAVHCDDDAADAAGKPSASSLSTKPSNESLESSSASETEDSEGSTSAPTSTAKPQRAISRVEDQSSSRETLSLSSSGVHNPLAGYRQLHCSMSYKNRQHVMSEDGIRLSRDSMRVSRLSSSFISSHASNYTPSVPSPSSQPESLRPSETLLRNSSMRSMHSVPESEREVEEAVEVDVDADVEDAVDDSTETKRERLSSVESAASNSSRPSEKVTEASVLAMQARRAFQQMALEMEDEESEEDDDEGYDSRQSSDSIVIRMNPRIVKLGADEYRKFQFRLRQLEDLTQEQARKQAAMEVTIEEEVQARTRQVTEAMEKKIAMYKRAKDLECEREIERRTMPSERESAMSGFSSRPSVRDTIMTPSSFNSQDASRQSRTFEKIMHPRRTRRRLEMLKQREEQTKQEMEQFREFLRTTESYVRQTEVGLNGSMPNTADARAKAESARQSLKALNDPHISEDLLLASQNELIEMICILRSHVSVQEEQLEEAKHLIEVAIAARDEAEATAQEAVELTMQLDSELQRTSQQLGEHLNGEHDHENPAWAMDRDSSSSSLLGSSQATLRTPSSSTQSSTAQF